MSQTAFTSLPLHPDLLGNLESLGYQHMTAIQAESLPAILNGRDVIGQGRTGSGKTAAFALGLLNRLEVKRFRIQSLVLCPTRELADQVAGEIRRLGRSIHNIKVLTLCGGLPFGPQAGSLEHGAHIIVGTPGRILDHLSRGTLSLGEVEMLVLDEADRMLEMGFQEALDAILAKLPQQRQTLLFSATFPPQIKTLAASLLRDPLTAKAPDSHDAKSIEQHFYAVADSERDVALQQLLLHFQPSSTVVFCNTKAETQAVADQLLRDGFSAIALHGDLEQRDRDETLLRFANRSIAVLVATDVAARGLDVDGLDAVVNYHIAHDAESHTHRIGRTGRAGSKGLALSLFSEQEAHKVARLEDSELDPLRDQEPLPAAGSHTRPAPATMTTVLIDGGKKQKLRPGDILGALTSQGGLDGKEVGKIAVFDQRAYVAVPPKRLAVALKKLGQEKMKGKKFRARELR